MIFLDLRNGSLFSNLLWKAENSTVVFHFKYTMMQIAETTTYNR